MTFRGVKEEFLIACCNDHDVCYGMCERTKDQCDSAFRRSMIALCDTILSDNWWQALCRLLCSVDALVLHRAVVAFGETAFNDAQSCGGCNEATSSEPSPTMEE